MVFNIFWNYDDILIADVSRGFKWQSWQKETYMYLQVVFWQIKAINMYLTDS